MRMLKIEENDFIMERSTPFSNVWDLQLKVMIKEKSKGKLTGGTREEFKNAGYGLPMESCISKIILNRIERKTETVDLKEFGKLYKKLTKELTETFKNI